MLLLEEQSAVCSKTVVNFGLDPIDYSRSRAGVTVKQCEDIQRASSTKDVRKHADYSYPRASSRSFLCWAALWLFWPVGVAFASDANYYTQGIANGIPSLEEIPGEYVDARTGRLYWETVDAVIPGNGGLDIVLARYVDKMGQPSRSRLLGKYWSFSIPQLLAETACSFDGVHGTAAAATLLLPGIPPKTFYVVEQGDERYPAGAKQATEDNWYFECSGPSNTEYTVFAPNGTRYIMASSGYVGAPHLVTRVEDVHGNWLEYNYTFESNFRHPAGIVASDGRAVEFEYENHFSQRGYQARMGSVSFNGRKITYSYEGLSLSSATLPDGTSWLYEYHPPVNRLALTPFVQPTLTAVVLPTGARVSYEYEHRPETFFGLSNNGGHGVWPIKSRTVAIGPIVRTCRYSYKDKSQAVHESTTIECPERTEELVFHSDRKSRLFGVQILRRVRAPGTGRVIRTEQYHWVAHARIGAHRLLRHPETGWRRVLGARTIDDALTTEYVARDEYGNLLHERQWSNDNRVREYRYSYLNSQQRGYSNWLVGLLETRRLQHATLVDELSYAYDVTGQLLSATVDGITTHFGYDGDGSLHWTKSFGRNSAEAVTWFEDYKRGVARVERHPEGVTIERGVNDSGTIAWETDGRGFTTAFEYDSMDRRTSITRPGLQAIRTVYQPDRITTSRASGSYQEIVHLDELGREELRARSANGLETSYIRTAYDIAGNKSFVSYPSTEPGETLGTYRVFDGLGRVVSKQDTARAEKEHVCYDLPECRHPATPPGRNFVRVTSPRGHQTHYERVGFHDTAELWTNVVRHPEGTDTVMTYDLRGNRRTVTQGGVVRRFEYAMNSSRVASVVEPEQAPIAMEYDPSGNLIRRTQAGQRDSLYYDGLNRLGRIVYEGAAQTTTFDYDKSSNLSKVTNGDAQRRYAYTPFGELDYETLVAESRVRTVDYGYNHNGVRNYIAYPSGLAVTTLLDEYDRPTNIGGFVSSISYAPDDQVTSYALGNGSTVVRTYNASRLPERIVASGAFEVAAHLRYQYDGNRNVGRIEDWLDRSNDVSAEYDPLERLQTATGPWGAGWFQYDPAGNLTRKALGDLSDVTYGYDATNRVLWTGGSVTGNYSYDVRGNMLGNGRREFRFDRDNRMTEVLTIGGGTELASYRYDGNGIRVVEETATGGALSFYGGGGQLLYEADLHTGTEAAYVYFEGQKVARVTASCDGLDSDSDGIADCVEMQWGLNQEDPTDARSDWDGDGLSNLEETQWRTSPVAGDSDFDGMPDRYEVLEKLNPLFGDAYLDPDGDGVANLDEYLARTGPFDPSNVRVEDYMAPLMRYLLRSRTSQ